jgi:hypothetical protein
MFRPSWEKTYRNANIGSKEAVPRPVAVSENFPAIEKNDNGEVDEAEPCSVWLPLALED